MYYIFKLCKSSGAWEMSPKGRMRIDLLSLARKFPKAKTKTKVILVVEIEGVTISIYPSGRILLYDCDEEKGRRVGSKIFRVISGEGKQEKKTGTALFIGRFQPLHYGHMQVIRDILKENERIVIAVGSSQESGTEKNPFTFLERKGMIETAFREANIDNYEIIPVEDVHDDLKWVESVRKQADFDVVYTRNPWTERCFRKAGVPVVRHRLFDRYRNCGTRIREKMKSGKSWDELVPAAVYDYLRKIKAEERMRGS